MGTKLYKPGDIWRGTFSTRNASGATTAADSLPAGTVSKEGVDDGTVTVTITQISGGRYKFSLTIPVSPTYQSGYELTLWISATVGGVTDIAPVESIRLASVNLIGAYADGLVAMGSDYASDGFLQAGVANIGGSNVLSENPTGSITFPADVGDATAANQTTILNRLTAARAAYLDNLNVGGNVASHADTANVVLAAAQPNYAPAKAGDAMTLTGTYDAAKTAATQASVNLIPTNPLLTNDARITTIVNNTSSIKITTDLLATGWTVVGGAIVFTIPALANAPQGGGGGGTVNITVTPVTATVSAGEVAGDAIVAYQNAAATFVFAVVDSAGNAINLTGKTVRFAASPRSTPNSPVLLKDNSTHAGLTVTGPNGNTVTVSLAAGDTTTVRTLSYSLFNITDDVPLATGTFEILPIPQG